MGRRPSGPGTVEGETMPEGKTMRWNLPDTELPTTWFNVVPLLPEPIGPPLHPATRQPLGPDDLAPLFPMALIAQEMTTEPTVEIPGEVLDVLRLWRPTPLVRATRLEKALGTPARIYYKDESVSPAGSHKPNTAVPQAFYNKAEGVARLTTETGAGQWGSALSFACAFYGLECKVYMVRASYEQKPYRRVLMETWGGSVVPSPVDEPGHPGSLGAAISVTCGPYTMKTWPLTSLAAGDARKRTRVTTCSGDSGSISPSAVSGASPKTPAVIAVLARGAIAFAQTPYWPSARAAVRVSAVMPAFAAP